MALLEATVGASRLLWGADGEVDLGVTRDGGRLHIEIDVIEQRSVYTGSTPCGFFVGGRRVWAEVEVAERSLLDLLDRLTDVAQRAEAEHETNVARDVPPFAGTLWPSDRLCLRPLGAGGAAGRDIVLWKAALRPSLEFAAQEQEARFFRLRFEALVDVDEAGRARLARFGDWEIAPTYMFVGGA